MARQPNVGRACGWLVSAVFWSWVEKKLWFPWPFSKRKMRVHTRFARTCNIFRVTGVIVRMPYLPSRKVRWDNSIWYSWQCTQPPEMGIPHFLVAFFLTLLNANVRNRTIVTQLRWSLQASLEVNFCPISKTNTPLQRDCNNLNKDGLFAKIRQGMTPWRLFEVSQHVNVSIDRPWHRRCRSKRELSCGNQHA